MPPVSPGDEIGKAGEEDGQLVGSAQVGSSLRPSDQPSHLERTRAWLAWSLVGLFGLEVLASLVIVAIVPERTDAVLKILQVVVSPTVGLVGAVGAFYYARQRD